MSSSTVLEPKDFVSPCTEIAGSGTGVLPGNTGSVCLS